MVRIDKQHVGNLLLVELLSEKNLFLSKIRHFESKYGADFALFEKRVSNAQTENQEEWDDLIDWQAAIGFLSKTQEQITDIRNGHIEVAG